MSCNPFSVNVPEGWFTKVAEEIKAAGGSIRGDAGSGEFSVPVPKGVVIGKYVLAATELEITITQRPFWLMCVLIESFVRKRFGGA